MGAQVSVLRRAAAAASIAYQAFVGPSDPNAVRLREMPAEAIGRASEDAPERTRRIGRLPLNYRQFMPPDVDQAMNQANGSGILGGIMGVATIATWVKSNPIVGGLMRTRCGVSRLPYEIKGSEAARRWIKGDGELPGIRSKVANPKELRKIAIDRYNVGVGVGVFVWDKKKNHPRLMALDPAGLRYIPDQDRWEYRGWSKTFKVCPGDGIWVLYTLCDDSPWREGAWYSLAFEVIDALQGSMARGVFTQAFSMPTVLAKSPQAATDTQKASFTESVIGGFLTVIGVTPGYDIEFKQATAEGADVFAASEAKLERWASVFICGTAGIIDGGQGFANSDMFAGVRGEILEEEAEDLAELENSQIWPQICKWGVAAGHLPAGNDNACINYIAKPSSKLKAEAEAVTAAANAVKAMREADMSPDADRIRIQWQMPIEATKAPTDDGANVKQALNGAQIASAVAIVTSVATNQMPRDAGVAQLKILLNVEDSQAEQMMGTAGAGFIASIDGAPPMPQPQPAPPPDAREAEEPEPHYSEMIAEQLNTRGEDVCPCPNHADRHCPRCGVVRRPQVKDGQWASVWQPVRRRAA